MATPDMDVIKEIPGYKVIMKAILKSQIQQLVEQLASHTDEESVILTASVSDGTLSHLGTDSGKNFLDDHEDIKSQFLGFCLKRHHRQKAQQQKEQQQQQQMLQQQQQQLRSPTWPTHHGPGPGGPRPRLGTPGRQIMPRHSVPRYPMSVPSGLGKSVRHEPYPISKPRRSVDSNFDIGKVAAALEPSVNSSPVVKLEPEDSSSQHSKNDGESSPSDKNIPNDDNQSHDPNTPGGASDSNTSDPQNSDLDVNVKVEAISEADMELEITGVELGGNTDPMGSQKDPWPSNLPMGFDPTGATGSPGDMQSGYNGVMKLQNNSSFQLKDMNLGQGQGCIVPSLNLVHDVASLAKEGNICPMCGKLFSSKWKRDTHLRIHTGEKPFSCNVCGKTFNVKGNLKNHMLRHYHNDTDYLNS